MKAFCIIAGVLLIIMSLLLLVVSPFAVVGIALGLFFILYGKKYKKKTPNNSEDPKKITMCQEYRISETEKFSENLLEIARENDDFDMSKKEIVENGMEDETIYRYLFLPKKVELLPKDEITEVYADRQLIGFLSEQKTLEMASFKESHEVHDIGVDIWGGPYKYYDSDKESLSEREKPYGAKLLLYWYKS